jgi:hypothetical protein
MNPIFDKKKKKRKKTIHINIAGLILIHRFLILESILNNF